MMKQATIGVVGLGRMGQAMVRCMMEKGVLPSVYNRSPGKLADITDIQEFATLATLARAVDVILVIVSDAEALRDVYTGRDGLCSVDLTGKTVVEMSTVAIQDTLEMLKLAEKLGAYVIDAPVSGSVIPAREGQLLVMAGGGETALERARPALDLIARRVVHAGPLGAGITMKLVVNLPLGSYMQTLGEAIGLGLRNGLSLENMLATIADSGAAIRALPRKLDWILDESKPAEFDLAGLAKDLSAMVESAAAVGLVIPACEAARDSARSAVTAGWGDRDASQLVRFTAEHHE